MPYNKIYHKTFYVLISGANTDHVKVVKLSNLYKIGKYGKKIGEKSGKIGKIIKKFVENHLIDMLGILCL